MAAIACCFAIVGAAAAPPWKEAMAGYAFEFPRDHASHPDYKIEWWYYTGNVSAKDGRRFGYQVTFFRVGVDAAPTNPSRWAIRDLFMTHLAVSDPKGGRYRYSEKLTRGGPGLAGADVERYHVWNEDWTASLDPSTALRAGDRQHKLRAISKEAGIDLTLNESKPPAINGVDGISQKGAQAGNASHYYSMTRMPTRGTITVDGERVEVSGLSWMDHEFGTSFLEPGQRGWDWLSIQLADGRDLMLYQLRRSDGSRDPRSSGTLVGADGRTTHLAAGDFSLTPGRRTFRSANGAIYPIEWAIAIPSQKIDLRVTTPLDNQELDLGRSTGVAYWEGAIDVAGRSAGQDVSGHGYLEMTGYKDSLGRVLSQK
ncbi:MAG: lipocalin-like domain-containing protein [Acidobacteriota bacterium]|nr:lipocalin-like domain-containing protein [Acidobacteriota bacterium]